jgi:RNA-directed DNA polymerase
VPTAKSYGTRSRGSWRRLRLSAEKTLITHVDEGLDFLGWRIQRRVKRGTAHRYVYTYPAKKSVKSVDKVKTICRASGQL